jgi:sedoheptulose-bisphosphatase
MYLSAFLITTSFSDHHSIFLGLEAVRTIGTNLRAGGYSSDKVGTTNAFGDHQLEVDVQTDEVIFNCLRASGNVHVAASEENPVEIDCGGVGYSVSFDPLDGSSIVDCNFAVGTIAGIFSGNGLLNRVGRDQVASFVAQYGPRVTVALAINGSATASGEALAVELTMFPDRWVVTIPRLQIKPKAKTFAPGNLRATSDNEKYQRLVNYWITNKYTLRYSGGLVPDVYHILIKGEGVLANASSKSAKAKLRLLFEAAPIALIVEAAGGASCVCASEAAEDCPPVSLLDVRVSDLDKRVGVCYGSAEEVQRFREHIFS